MPPRTTGSARRRRGTNPMAAERLPVRELGRTGLQVTQLGYGALDLGGGSWGRGATDEQASAILNAEIGRAHV